MASSYGLIVMPTYNDWRSCTQLISALDAALAASGDRTYRVLIVDDGSTVQPESLLPPAPMQCITSIEVLRLKRNLGHQRAICIALSYIESNLSCEAVILMDSDGEDDPTDVPRLLQRFEEEHQEAIVFARRTKRSEYWMFRVFLQLYKITHYLLTGKGIYVGNFSVIPYRKLSALVTIPELWSHYAAAVMHTRLPNVLVPAARAKRLDGSSHMSFTGLVMHGLSAISVYSETIGIRLLIASGMLLFMVVAGIMSFLMLTDSQIALLPGSQALLGGLVFVVLMQLVLLALSFSFIVMSGRRNAGFIPARDFHFFVDKLEQIWEKESSPSNM